jgi:hypothetical protein
LQPLRITALLLLSTMNVPFALSIGSDEPAEPLGTATACDNAATANKIIIKYRNLLTILKLLSFF